MKENLALNFKLNLFLCALNVAVIVLGPSPATGIALFFAVYTGMTAIFCLFLYRRLKDTEQPKVQVKDLYPKEKE